MQCTQRDSSYALHRWDTAVLQRVDPIFIADNVCMVHASRIKFCKKRENRWRDVFEWSGARRVCMDPVYTWIRNESVYCNPSLVHRPFPVSLVTDHSPSAMLSRGSG